MEWSRRDLPVLGLLDRSTQLNQRRFTCVPPKHGLGEMLRSLQRRVVPAAASANRIHFAIIPRV